MPLQLDYFDVLEVAYIETLVLYVALAVRQSLWAAFDVVDVDLNADTELDAGMELNAVTELNASTVLVNK